MQQRVKAKAIDRKKQQGWILWVFATSFFLAGSIIFFSLTI